MDHVRETAHAKDRTVDLDGHHYNTCQTCSNCPLYHCRTVVVLLDVVVVIAPVVQFYRIVLEV
jgi:hypothetical protein